MPWLNFCKKCKMEVLSGEQCPHCAGKLTKTGERLSFGLVRTPVRDWFAWNQVLRVALPALALVAAATLILEGMLSGGRGIRALFLQGFWGSLAGVLAVMLLGMLVLLALQGKEVVRFVLDKDGVHAYTYLHEPTTLQLYTRFLTWPAAEKLQREELRMEGYFLVKRVELLWADVKRARLWPENGRILLFNPTWWQAVAVACPAQEYGEAEAFLRKKLGRNKKVRIVP